MRQNTATGVSTLTSPDPYDEVLAALQPRVRVIRDFAQWLHGHSIPDHITPVTTFDAARDWMATLDPVQQFACGLIAARIALVRFVPADDEQVEMWQHFQECLDVGFRWLAGAASERDVVAARQRTRERWLYPLDQSVRHALATRVAVLEGNNWYPGMPRDEAANLTELELRDARWLALRGAWQSCSGEFSNAYRQRFLRDWHGRCLALLSVAGDLEGAVPEPITGRERPRPQRQRRQSGGGES